MTLAPLSRAAAERGAVPVPCQAVSAGRVAGDHLVRLIGIGQRMTRRPQMPPAAVPGDHGILHARRRIARQRHPARECGEPGRMAGFDHFDPPVLTAMGGAAQIQAPRPVCGPDERGPLQRLGIHLFFADGHHRLEMLAIGRPCHHDRVTMPAADRPPEPVRQVMSPSLSTALGAPAQYPAPAPGAAMATAERSGWGSKAVTASAVSASVTSRNNGQKPHRQHWQPRSHRLQNRYGKHSARTGDDHARGLLSAPDPSALSVSCLHRSLVLTGHQPAAP